MSATAKTPWNPSVGQIVPREVVNDITGKARIWSIKEQKYCEFMVIDCKEKLRHGDAWLLYKPGDEPEDYEAPESPSTVAGPGKRTSPGIDFASFNVAELRSFAADCGGINAYERLVKDDLVAILAARGYVPPKAKESDGSDS